MRSKDMLPKVYVCMYLVQWQVLSDMWAADGA